MQDEQERHHHDGDELRNETGGPDGDVLERPGGLGEYFRQAVGVPQELGGDVVPVVVMTEGRVAAQLRRVVRRVMRERMHLADEAWYHHIADQPDQQGEDHIYGEDDDERDASAS